MGWEKRHGILTSSATEFRGYVLVQFYIFFGSTNSELEEKKDVYRDWKSFRQPF
jgi:hypothetical protein